MEQQNDSPQLPDGFAWRGSGVVLTGFARQVREELCPEKLTPALLARVYAAVDNELSVLMAAADEELWNAADEDNFQEVEELERVLREEIFARLRLRDAPGFARRESEVKGCHWLVEPFMRQYGLRDGSGWWVEGEPEPRKA